MINKQTKLDNLSELSEYKQKLRLNPQLRHLFLELTLRCNEHCLHCGSSCGDIKSEEMSTKQYMDFLDKVKQDFGTDKMMLCITGGEPLLRKDFFDIMGYAHKLGFKWGMTTNATLIDENIANKLKECGMGTVAVSIDGLPETHDSFRRKKGGYDAAIKGIKHLIDQHSFSDIMVTTVIHKKNINELDELFNIFSNIDITSWRIINLEPIGRAKLYPDLHLEKNEYIKMFDFIKEKRKQGWPIMYGCSHFLGLDYEREVRDWYFLCNAGVYTASIMANGDIAACLDIERRPELIQGNIFKDDFSQVWRDKFEIFRKPLSEKNEKCKNCEKCHFCEGGAYHSWDYDKNEPQICFKGTLF